MRIHNPSLAASLSPQFAIDPNRVQCAIPQCRRFQRRFLSKPSRADQSAWNGDFARPEEATKGLQHYRLRNQPKFRLASLGAFLFRGVFHESRSISRATQTSQIPIGFARRFFSKTLLHNQLARNLFAEAVVRSAVSFGSIAFSPGRSLRWINIEFAESVRSRRNMIFQRPAPVFGSRVKSDPGKRCFMRLPLLSRNVERFTESVIRGMSVEAKKYGAINLAQGMPDFSAPDEVKRAAFAAIEADINQYAVTWGSQRLREAVAEHAAWHLGMNVDPETEITVTCGATEAMLVTLMSIINPGDEVILTQPFYENYWPDCVLAGATPRFVTIRPPSWTFDPDELAAAFNEKTKAIVLCNPNNPTGTVFSREELEIVAGLCRKWNVVAISDEIYEHIVYDGLKHVSIATLDGMRDLSATISGMSKTFAVTGWRVGTIVASAALTRAFRQLHDYVSIGAAAPLQEAGAVAYRLPRSYFDRLALDYQDRRDRFLKVLGGVGFDCEPPRGAYYVMAGIDAFALGDDVEFAKYLVREIGVATVPGSSFFRDKDRGRRYVRFCFCKRDETLAAAAERLRKLRVVV
jgi:aminotransferase